MRARKREAEADRNGTWMKRFLFLFLMVAVVSAVMILPAACGSAGSAATPARVQRTSAIAVVQVTTTTAGAATTTETESAADRQEDLLSPAQDVLAEVYPSVVNIAVTATVGGQTGTGIGSGVVYTSDGLILTNDHVVTLDGAVSSGQSIVVTFSDDSHTDATIVGEDATHDIAALKVNKTGLTPIRFTMTGPMQLAEWAIVIGSPLDFRNSVTLGIVSGLDRTLQTSASQPPLTGLVQIDAPISPGNSGGGCFDARGQFIGMPEVYLPPGQTGAVDIGFAIPGETVHTVAQGLTGR